MWLKLLRDVPFGAVLCLVGTNYINSANAQQTDQQTIVTEAEAALAIRKRASEPVRQSKGHCIGHMSPRNFARAYAANRLLIQVLDHNGQQLVRSYLSWTFLISALQPASGKLRRLLSFILGNVG